MNPHLHAWLLDGQPLPPDLDAEALLAQDPQARRLADELRHLQSAAADLEELEPPAWLDDAVLGAVATEAHRPANRPWWAALRSPWPYLTLASAVAAALLSLRPPPPPAEPMAPRGLPAASAPALGLELAVDPAVGSPRRLQRGEQLAVGDTLLFRYDLPADRWLGLARIGPEEAQLLHQAHYPAGTGDLMLEEATLGYTLEEGEGAAIFVLLASERPLEASRVEPRLSGAGSPETACAGVAPLRAACQAVAVEAAR